MGCVKRRRSFIAVRVGDGDDLPRARRADDGRIQDAQRVTAYRRAQVGMVIALDDQTVMFGVDFEKAAAARLEMLAESHGNGPKQLVGVGRKANAFTEIQEKKRIRFRLLAPGDIANRDVDAKELAALGMHRVVAAQANAAFLAVSLSGGWDFLIDHRLTRIDDPPIMALQVVGKLGRRFADGLADKKLRRATVDFRHGVVDRDIAQIAVDEAETHRGGGVDGSQMGQALGGYALVFAHHLLSVAVAQTQDRHDPNHQQRKTKIDEVNPARRIGNGRGDKVGNDHEERGRARRHDFFPVIRQGNDQHEPGNVAKGQRHARRQPQVGREDDHEKQRNG